MVSSSQPGSDAAAREQRASRATQNWTDMMRRHERAGPGFRQLYRTAVESEGPDINLGDGERVEVR